MLGPWTMEREIQDSVEGLGHVRSINKDLWGLLSYPKEHLPKENHIRR